MAWCVTQYTLRTHSPFTLSIICLKFLTHQALHSVSKCHLKNSFTLIHCCPDIQSLFLYINETAKNSSPLSPWQLNLCLPHSLCLLLSLCLSPSICLRLSLYLLPSLCPEA